MLRLALLAVLAGYMALPTLAQEMSRAKKREILETAAKAFENPLPDYQSLQGQSRMAMKVNMGFINLEFESTEKIWYDKTGLYRSEKEEFTNFDGKRKQSTIVINGKQGWEQLGDSTVTPLDEVTIAEKLENPLLGISGDENSPLTSMLGGNTPELDADKLTDEKLDSLIYRGTDTFEGRSCYVFEILVPTEDGKLTPEEAGEILLYVDEKEHLLRGANIQINAKAMQEGEQQGPFANIGNVAIKATIDYHSGNLGLLMKTVNVTASSDGDSNALSGSLVYELMNMQLNKKVDTSLFDEPQPSN